MKWIIPVLAMILVGCTETPKEPVEEPIKTRPNIRKPKTRMIAQEKPITVAVIDTGFGNRGLGAKAKLCKFGHKDFTGTNVFVEKENLEAEIDPKSPVPLDRHGHGTNIVGIIDKFAEDANYCIVIIKFYDPAMQVQASVSTLKAIRYATSIKADIINYSGGGIERNVSEDLAIKKFLDEGHTFIAAAGNEKSDIDGKSDPYYPAKSDPRVIVVGNAQPIEEKDLLKIEDEDREKKTVYIDNKMAFVSESSNYGYRVNRWENGKNVTGFGIIMTGTSQATAIVTGKIIKNH